MLNSNSKDQGQLHDRETLDDDDCIKRFVCQLIAANISVANNPELKYLKNVELLQEALHRPQILQDGHSWKKNNKLPHFIFQDSYSIYDWGDLIKQILG